MAVRKCRLFARPAFWSIQYVCPFPRCLTSFCLLWCTRLCRAAFLGSTHQYTFCHQAIQKYLDRASDHSDSYLRIVGHHSRWKCLNPPFCYRPTGRCRYDRRPICIRPHHEYYSKRSRLRKCSNLTRWTYHDRASFLVRTSRHIWLHLAIARRQIHVIYQQTTGPRIYCRWNVCKHHSHLLYLQSILLRRRRPRRARDDRTRWPCRRARSRRIESHQAISEHLFHLFGSHRLAKWAIHPGKRHHFPKRRLVWFHDYSLQLPEPSSQKAAAIL